MQELLQLFPAGRRLFWRRAFENVSGLQEIRLRMEQPVILLINGAETFLSQDGSRGEDPQQAYRPQREEIEQLLEHICHYSLYAYEEGFRQGFLSVSGGHRVGIAGQVVTEADGSIRTMKNITCLNIRIACQIKGAADAILPWLYERGQLKNVLIISPPGCGKTTLLRDLIRQVSDGNLYGTGKGVCLVDERSEIAGCWMGRAQNDVGIRTDVLDACPKAGGMMLLLRSMSPSVIAVDELGGRDDMKALRMVSYCGVKVLATIHGADVEDALNRMGENYDALQIFDLFVLLGRENGKPMVTKIMKKEEAYASFAGRNYDHFRMPGAGNLV